MTVARTTDARERDAARRGDDDTALREAARRGDILAAAVIAEREGRTEEADGFCADWLAYEFDRTREAAYQWARKVRGPDPWPLFGGRRDKWDPLFLFIGRPFAPYSHSQGGKGYEYTLGFGVWRRERDPDLNSTDALLTAPTLPELCRLLRFVLPTWRAQAKAAK